MDGLSAAASGIAVVSIAIQLAESMKKAHDFWSSVKDAPEDIQLLSIDLKLWSSLFAQIAEEAQNYPPNDVLIAALERCTITVKSLTKILDEIEPGFSAQSSRRRYWAAFKTVLKGGKIAKFQGTLERLNSTLQLVQQNQAR